MKKTIVVIMITTWMAAAPAFAAGDHEHMHGHQDADQTIIKDMYKAHGINKSQGADTNQDAAFMKKMPGKILLKKIIDGYTVHFYVMKAKPGMEMGGSHDFMIKVEKDGSAIKKLIARSKVIHPDGKSEQKMMMMMGYWYMSGYDLGHKGQHQLMALFKTTDGVKHFGGIYYPEAGKNSK